MNLSSVQADRKPLANSRTLVVTLGCSAVFLNACGGGSNSESITTAAPLTVEGRAHTLAVPPGWIGRAPLVITVEKSPLPNTTGVMQIINQVPVYALAKTTNLASSSRIAIKTDTTALPKGANTLINQTFLKFENLTNLDDRALIVTSNRVSEVYECDAKVRECVGIGYSSNGGGIVFSISPDMYYAVVRGE